jgi:pyruvate,water dikinase
MAMVVKLDDRKIPDDIGNKAKFLMLMKKNGFNVPNGIVLSSTIFNTIINENKINDKIDKILLEFNKDNIKTISQKLIALFDSIIIPQNIIDDVKQNIKSNTMYAVRSSGLKEDMINHSFAGQYSTFLNVKGINNIKEAIINCYKSMYSDTILSYLINNEVDTKKLEMAIIIQEMVNSDISGIAFTINPLTGIDKEIVVEVAKGLGENIVSGKVKPERYIYNWYDEKYVENNNKLLNKRMLSEMMKTFLDIQMYFGYPSDIEFAIQNNKLYILQARPITKIMYSKISDQWTTADFKDGGVSSTVCYPFMWSLYEYIWEISYREFLHKGVLVSKNKLGKLGDMFYGRPYWNLSKAKMGMAKVPGYKEREFDNDLGVKITYNGDGVTTKLTPISLINVLRIFVNHRTMTLKRLKKNESYRQQLLSVYNNWLSQNDRDISLKTLENDWKELIFRHYLESESTYFNQIFINTVGQSVYKDSITKYISPSDYLNLMAGLNDISHLRPFTDIWNISRDIRNDKESYDFWKESSIEEIKKYYYNNSKKYFIPKLIKNIKLYGYHSDKELDVTYPHYLEDPTSVIISLKETVKLDDGKSPINDEQYQKEKYQKELDKLHDKLKSSKYKLILNSIEEMRKMLWWREEFRDISTRFYFLIRLHTLKLARLYVDKKIMNDISDIWYLKIEDLRLFIDKEISQKRLQEIILKNKKYYNSFKNFTGENEIGHVFDASIMQTNDNQGLKGVGCNNGIVTGIARVVNDFNEIDRIQVDDILITKFTDTGWTSKFAILKGIVTEYGGILCHAAIVSREYGIPCIVCANNVTKKIKDGTTIMINGSTGEIKIVKE